ncbi:hypothetical protein ACHQM5_026663 [Ranunculus cassubicifolius]
MPLYDCMLLLKPHVQKEKLMDLVARVGRHVQMRNGVLTDIKSFGTVHLGYGIKKLDGKYFQGQLMQMTMMATPNLNKELHYLNKEDRLLRWLLVKHRNVKYGSEGKNEDLLMEDDGPGNFSRSSIYDVSSDEAEDSEDYDEDIRVREEEKEESSKE